MTYIGDFATGVTLDHKFTTVTTTGAPTQLAGTPAISVYKDNSTTQSTSGVTLTVDFDTVTGLNNVRIDTSSDGTFYSAGSNFQIVITTGTVGGTSVVGYVVGSFSLANRSALRPTTAGRTLAVNASGDADANLTKISGSAVSTSSAQLGVNVVTVADAYVPVKKNVAVSKFPFYMELTAGGPATGKTVTVQVSKDGGAFATVSDTVTEISGGWYEVDLSATETNADTIAFKATATSCNQRNITFITAG